MLIGEGSGLAKRPHSPAMRRAVSPEGGRKGEIKKATIGSLLSDSEVINKASGGQVYGKH